MHRILSNSRRLTAWQLEHQWFTNNKNGPNQFLICNIDNYYSSRFRVNSEIRNYDRYLRRFEGYDKYEDWRAFTEGIPESLKGYIVYFEVKNNRYNKIIVFRDEKISKLLVNEIQNKNIQTIININTFAKTVQENPNLITNYTCAHMSSDCTHKVVKGDNVVVDTVGWISKICKIMPMQYTS